MNRSTSANSQATGRVLVVDDHQQARESVAFALRQAGHQVDCLASAVEALRVLVRETYDVIITDLLMPGMTGLEFIRQLDDQAVVCFKDCAFHRRRPHSCRA